MAKERHDAGESKSEAANIYAQYWALLTGQSMLGRDTLPNLAREVAEMDYQSLPVETKQAYVNML